MAVRPIDANSLLDELTQIAHGMGRISIHISDMVKVMTRVVERQTTLTPPNEPLTLDELRQMDGEPVWVDDEKTYAILQVWDDDNIDAIFPKPRGCIHAKYVIGMKIYRRPPEGEDT